MRAKLRHSIRRLTNPRASANFASLVCFWYSLQTFRKGWQSGFTEDDLYETEPQYKSQLLGDALQREWEREKLRSNPSLFKALRRLFLKAFAKYCLILIAIQLTRLTQPISLYFLMKFYEPNQTDFTKIHALICTFCIVLQATFTVFAMHTFLISLQHLGMKARVACCSLVYRKCLKLSRKSLEKTTIGQIVNLVSNDVNKFDFVCLHLPFVFDVPVEIVVIAVIIYFFTGTSPYIGAAAVLLQIPLQIFLGEKLSKIRTKISRLADERVRLMSEIITGIQVIKLYTWEESFAKLIDDSRRLEIKQIFATGIIKSILFSLALVTSRVATFFTIILHLHRGNALFSWYVFMILVIFGVMRQSMTVALPNAIAQIAETKVSIKRLQEFLLLDERPVLFNTDLEYVGFKMVDVCARWSSKSNSNININPYHNPTPGPSLNSGANGEDTLSNITLHLGNDDLLAIIGMVGSGKTSFLNLILQELQITQGILTINGQISYASQEPWIFSSTIKQNILFGQEYEQERYNEVLKVCALDRDLSSFRLGDNTVIGERGIRLSGGQRARVNLARAIYKKADIYLLDDPLSAVDVKVGSLIFEECIWKFLNGKCTVLVTHQVQYLKKVPKIMVLQNGRVTFFGEYEDIARSRSDLVNLLSQEKIADDSSTLKLTQNSDIIRDSSYFDSSHSVHHAGREQSEPLIVGKVSFKVYSTYIAAAGNSFVVFCLGLVFVSAQIFSSSCDIYLALWINVEENRGLKQKDQFGFRILSTQIYVYIYSTMIGSMVLMIIVRSLSFFAFCMQASYVLHKNMFDAVVKAPMKFFNKNSSGRILNRFARDMSVIDDHFPFVALDTIQIGLSVLGVVIVTLLINPFMIFPISIILIISYVLRILYLRTSRSVKRLEGITRSPVLSHLSSSLQGLTTIRASKVEDMLCKEFDIHQDNHTSAWVVFLFTSRAFGFFLDFICCIYIATVAFSFLLIFNEKHGANVGLAITQSLSLTGLFQWGMRQWSELENCMTSVERIREYTLMESESNAKALQPLPQYWPQNGNIEFRNVFLQYGPKEPYVLKNLNFKIKGNQKIGIVGRTGAGKSSIIASLFQLVQTEGQILIDNVDIQRVALKDLRSKIAIIPQEPILFGGTLRSNLDPFLEHSDALLWNVVEAVELYQVISELPSGLLSQISEGGANFSTGQRQLLCLARAIIRNNRILVLDEATAHVDPQTDTLIQATIRNKFKFCTVLTIAHRLHTILDADKVLVLENGHIVEFGYPYLLLTNKNGGFRSLVENLGPQTANEIMNSAKEVIRGEWLLVKNLPKYHRRLASSSLNSLDSEEDLVAGEENKTVQEILKTLINQLF